MYCEDTQLNSPDISEMFGLFWSCSRRSQHTGHSLKLYINWIMYGSNMNRYVALKSKYTVVQYMFTQQKVSYVQIYTYWNFQSCQLYLPRKSLSLQHHQNWSLWCYTCLCPSRSVRKMIILLSYMLQYYTVWNVTTLHHIWYLILFMFSQVTYYHGI